MRKSTALFAVAFLFFSRPLFAVSIVECEDQEGNRSFQKSCPPGYTELNRKRFYVKGAPGDRPTGEPATALGAGQSATLYMIPACDTCEEAREFLEANGVSVTEIDVSNDSAVQAEFAALAGELKVPVTVIDGQLLRGYSRAEFRAALAAGASGPDADRDDNDDDQAPGFEAPDIL